MDERLERTRLLFGDEAMERLSRARVAVFGLGGVGGHCAEALARSGVGTLELVDADRITVSNMNRQLFAASSTVGMDKTQAAARRLHDVSPSVKLNLHTVFYGPDTARQFDFSEYDYVVDAIDTVTGKLCLIEQAREAGTPVISAMGAGNKMDPTAFCVADIYETEVCPLARIMRKELRRRGVEHLKVVYSREEPRRVSARPEPGSRKLPPGSNAFVPAAVGLILAGEVVRDLIGWPQRA